MEPILSTLLTLVKVSGYSLRHIAAICIIRDPRDVAVSYAHHCQDNVDNTIDFMLKTAATINHDTRYHALGTWQEHVKSWLDPEVGFPRYVVKYEDMKNKPQKTFKGIVKFLGWDVDDDLLEASIDATRFSNLKKQEDESGFKEQSYSGANFFRKGSVGSWKEELTDAQSQRLVNEFGELMEKLGYDT